MISNGRVIFGIGAGWNVEEMEDQGAIFKRRWKILKEKRLAMREIWTKETAEFHGEFVNFEPMWSFPKPVQQGGPPVLLGSQSPEPAVHPAAPVWGTTTDRKSTRLNSSHTLISYAVFSLKKKKRSH